MPDGSFTDRLRAATSGGFAGLGMTVDAWRHANDRGQSDDHLRHRLGAAGVQLVQIESTGMPGLSDQKRFGDSIDDVLRMADTFGCVDFFVVGRANVPFEEHVDLFGRLCDRATTVGLRVGIEFMPIPEVSGYHDVVAASRLVEAVGRSNAGIVVDTFHHFRGSNDWSQLRSFPGDRVFIVQLNDAAALPLGDGYLDETMHHRLTPGEGGLPLVDFVRVMDGIGTRCAYSVEVLATSLSMLTPEDLGRRLGDGARGVLSAARIETPTR